jgi:glycosyltransferase involved in cell wall biosynthesis
LAVELEEILKVFDICIAHNIATLHKNLPLTAALSCLVEKRKIRMIAWCHDFAWLDPLYEPALHTGYPWDLLRTRWPGVEYVTVSEHRKNRLAQLFAIDPREISVIPPGVAWADFLKLEPLTRNLVDRLNLQDADPILLLPARVTRRKNIEFAIRVLASLREIHPKARLLVTGPPGAHNPTNSAYLESLSTLKSDLGVADRVHFLYEFGEGGSPLHVPDPVVADLFQLADILIFPSEREGFGIPIIEAGISRLPVFAADIPPVRESSMGYAYLFNPAEAPAKVGQAIHDHLNSDRVYKLRKVALANYSWATIIDREVIPLINQTARKSIVSTDEG